MTLAGSDHPSPPAVPKEPIMIAWVIGGAAVLTLFLYLIVSWGKAIHDEASITVPPRSSDTCPPDCPCRGTLPELGPEFWPTVYRHVMDEDRAQQLAEGVPAHLLYPVEGDDL